MGGLASRVSMGEAAGGRMFYAVLPMADPRETPAMQQYYRFKRQYPDCVLMFRIGDFYEMFDDDAVNVSKAIGLTLTQRQGGVPLAGVPFHQLETYLRRMIALGMRVAVCEQVEEASKAKGLVARAVTRVLTPGTLVDEQLLEHDAPSTLAAVCFTGEGELSPAALAVVEVSTGSFVLVQASGAGLVDELARRGVREVLYAVNADGKTPARIERVLKALGLSGTPRPAWHFRHDEALRALKGQFGVATLAGFGLRDDDALVAPAGAVIAYLKDTQTAAGEAEGAKAGGMIPRATLAHLRPPRREDPARGCVVDAVSLRALEVEGTIRGQGPGSPSGGIEGSLLGVFLTGASSCRTAMGKRLLREWLVRPLGEQAAIEARHDAVGMLVEARQTADQLGAALSEVQDVARIGGRIALARATPRDLTALGKSLTQIDALTAVIGNAPALAGYRATLEELREALAPLAAEILRFCVDAPPPHLREGGLIRDGVDAALDEARTLQRDAGSWLAKYQQELAERHNLPGIKVGFNKIFGYYIELPAAQSKRAPAELSRKQTLKNAERYTTPELQDFEAKVTTAESRAVERERVLFDGFCVQARELLPQCQEFAQAVAELDVLLGFAERAHRRGWVRPVMCAEAVLEVTQGRHPVLEQTLGTNFVPNDVRLGAGEAAAPVALITGPNMAGKSTFIRQTALLVLLAHAGSFVPAQAARIGVTDRIFTRIGADDALHSGQSTFMVEMIETANILHHATGKSLVVLDEIGRGTSTLDGLSLAWGIAEYLARAGEQATERWSEDGGRDSESADASSAGVRSRARSAAPPRTLFATHYHELTELADLYPGKVQNLHVEVREWPPGDPAAQIVFLHRISPGRTDQSYGIHVARLAGLPAGVIERAREVLKSLAVEHTGAELRAVRGEAARVESGREERKGKAKPEPAPQMSLFTEYMRHPALDRLAEVKIEQLSPMQAFDELRELRRMLDED